MGVRVLTTLGAGLGIGGAALAWTTARLHLWSGWGLASYGLIAGGLISLAIASGYNQTDREVRASRRHVRAALFVVISAVMCLAGRYLL